MKRKLWKCGGMPKTTWVFSRWFDYDIILTILIFQHTWPLLSSLSTLGGLILGEDLEISFCKAGDTISLARWLARSQVSLSGWRRWQSANISPVSVVVTQHIPDLITPQYQTGTAANMSQLPSGVMQRNRLLWCSLDAMAGNHSQPRYNCFPAKTFRHGSALSDEDTHNTQTLQHISILQLAQ